MTIAELIIQMSKRSYLDWLMSMVSDLQHLKRFWQLLGFESIRVRDPHPDQKDAIRREVDAIKLKVTFMLKWTWTSNCLMEIRFIPWYPYNRGLLSVDKTCKSNTRLS